MPVGGFARACQDSDGMMNDCGVSFPVGLRLPIRSDDCGGSRTVSRSHDRLMPDAGGVIPLVLHDSPP